MLLSLVILLLAAFFEQGFGETSIILYSDDPVVLGANVTFRAVVKLDSTSALYRFTWTDNATPQNQFQFETNETESSWTMNYSPSLYSPGEYNVYCLVERKILSMFWINIISTRKYFNVTGDLNGKMDITQGTNLVTGNYIEVNQSAKFQIDLNKPDYNYLLNNATSVKTYWFVDCMYYGFTNEYDFTETFTNLEGVHYVAGIVEASFEPLPPITTTTTSTTTTSTTSTTTTHAPPITTTISDNTTTNISKMSNTEVSTSLKTIAKRSIIDDLLGLPNMNDSNVNTYSTVIADVEDSNDNNPYICQNQTIISRDPKKLYGLFIRKVTVQEKVSNLSISGNNWLQQGDMLALQVKCHGSPPFEYCMSFRRGHYNVTGNETCRSPNSSNICGFPVIRYFSDTDVHTVLLIVSNNVGKVVSPVTITVYKVTKHAQLSVIVVPVVFSILAAILVVFGVAYYIQNRSRFTVEVADFDFAQQYTDMEYKTFSERLRDSFYNALSWAGNGGGEGGGAAGGSGRGGEHGLPSTSNNKYGSMT